MTKTRLSIPFSKLFKVFSFADDHPDLGAVRFEWYIKERPEPLVSYEALISDFHLLDEGVRGISAKLFSNILKS
jgi:hypothetical protein